MKRPPGHRKRVRHYHEAPYIHELTFSCYQRKPLLTTESRRRLLAGSVNRAIERHGYRLAAFVFMPEHFHLLVSGADKSSSIDALLRAIKRPFSYRVKQEMIQQDNPLFAELTIRQRPGVTTFRFWQEGPGYDRNITTPRAACTAIDYIHLNPVRRRLCQRAIEWKWSSARFYLGEESIDQNEQPVVNPLPAEWLDD